MMKIRNIYYIGVALLLAGCSNEADLTDGTLSGGGKTPLVIEASLSTGQGVTRAAGMEFAKNDQLLAYIRHISNTNAASVADYTSIPADQAPRLVTFTKGATTMADANANDGIKETTDLTASYTSTASATVSALYWDDFSNSSSTDTDLRTTNHGLQSYYGYCYNGGTPTTALTESTGVLGWTVAADQSASATTVQNQDLLWSPEQTAVTYAHTDAKTGAHGTLTIPYSHAMSEVTVTLTAGTGFTGSPLTSTTLTLNNMNTVATLTAPTSTVTSETSGSIKMYSEAGSSDLERKFTAIVAPRTKLKVDEVLLNIVNVDDNNYELKITSDMIGDSHWASGHEAADKGTEDSKAYILTKPGYNYHLDITVNKTEIEVRATIKDWTTVTASGTGDVQYDNDYTDLVMDDSEVGESDVAVSALNVSKFPVKSSSAFTLFWMSTTTDDAEAVTATENSSYDLATVSTFDGTNNVWTNSPSIYWPNKSTNYYFRALAKYKGKDGTDPTLDVIESAGNDKDVAVALTQGTMADGHDYLWGTTAKHYGNSKGKTYNRGQAISPRTGDVPIAFDHAMSKIKFTLTTTDDESVTVNNAKVDLTNATITITGIKTEGTISIETGDITGSTSGDTPALAQEAEYIVIPQDFSAYDTDAMVVITLNDGTIYKLKLKDCIVSSTATDDTPTKIQKWERGNYYNYTIHLEKEKITFRALIKDWETSVEGSGNANLEWD